MPIELNGTTGITTAGLTSTNMPTSGGDPIVESGSNSDGEWVKWAEGTQQCRLNGSASIVTGDWGAAGSALVQTTVTTTPYPLPFVGNIPAYTVSTNTFVFYRSTSTYSLSEVRISILRESAADYPTFEWSVSATGRWK